MKKIIIISVSVLVIAGLLVGIILINNSKYKKYTNQYNELVTLKDNLEIIEEEQKEIEKELKELKQDIGNKANKKDIEKKKNEIKKKLEVVKAKAKEEITAIESKVKAIDTTKLNDVAKDTYDKAYAEYQELINSEKYKEAAAKIEEIKKTTEAAIQPSVMTNAFKMVKNSTSGVIDYIEGKFNANGTIQNTTAYSFSKVVIHYDVICTSGGIYKCADFDVTVKDVKPNETRKFNKTGFATNTTAQYGGDKLKFKSIKAYK